MAPNALGDRMKAYEAGMRPVLPRRSYCVVRVDGKNFSRYTKDLARPYDEAFMADMDAVASALTTEISGSVLAYTQSDEISVLFTDLPGLTTEPHHGGSVNKIVSLTAALATATLNLRRPGALALFDARVFTLPNAHEVANYFLWRQNDATRNSISMSAQAVFSHRSLQGLHSGAVQEKLFTEKGINWNDYPVGFKRGRVTTRVTEPSRVTYTDKRTGTTETIEVNKARWVTTEAPRFDLDPAGFLAGLIPAQPAF